MNAGPRTLSKGHNQKKAQSCPARNGERGCVTHGVTLLVPRAFPIAFGVRAKLESRTIKEPVYRLINDLLTEMQFLYDAKIIRHALIQYPSSGVEIGSC